MFIKKIRELINNRPRPVLNVIERTKRKAVYGAISLGGIIGFVVVLIVKGCL